MAQAERGNWWMLPWAWTTRVPSSLLGVHGSSILLEADSPVWNYSFLPGFLLTIGLTLVGIGPVVFCGASGGAGAPMSPVSRFSRLLPGGRDAVDNQSETVSAQSPEQAPGARSRSISIRRAMPTTRMIRVPGSCSATLAMAGVLPWIVQVVLAILLLVFLGVLHIVYPPRYGQSFLELMRVPVAAALVGITVWGCFRPA